jgi:O-antigen ligase
VAVTWVCGLKMAWIAVLIEVLLWFALSGKSRKALVVLAIVVVVAAFPARQALVLAFGDLAKLPDPDRRAEALSGRVYVWSQYALDLRTASPAEILIGQGYEPSARGQTGYAVHDDYLRLLLMNGVVGLVTYAILMFAALRYLVRATRVLKRQGGIGWRISVAVQCLVWAYLLTGLTADPATYPSMTLYIWLLIGLTIGYANRVRAGRDIEMLQQPGSLDRRGQVAL